MNTILSYLCGFFCWAIIVLAIIGYLTLANPSHMVSAKTHNQALSETSHLRNLNWLLARQIEREKGGEQLSQMNP